MCVCVSNLDELTKWCISLKLFPEYIKSETNANKIRKKNAMHAPSYDLEAYIWIDIYSLMLHIFF